MGWAVVLKISHRSEGRHWVDTTKVWGVGEGMIRGAGCNACFVDTGPRLFTACQRSAFTRKANNLETEYAVLFNFYHLIDTYVPGCQLKRMARLLQLGQFNWDTRTRDSQEKTDHKRYETKQRTSFQWDQETLPSRVTLSETTATRLWLLSAWTTAVSYIEMTIFWIDSTEWNEMLLKLTLLVSFDLLNVATSKFKTS